MKPETKKRIQEEIEAAQKWVPAFPSPRLAFTFITPNREEYIEIMAKVPYIERLGYQIKVFHGTLEEMGSDAEDFDFYMTAGNSYGHLTGGYDGALAERFPGIQQELLSHLLLQYKGEINVGNCFPAPITTDVDMRKRARLLYTPTMRVPRRLPKGSDVPYLASYAALTCARAHWAHGPAARVLAVLMGTGTGGIPARVAIDQFCIALYNYTHGSNIKNLFRDGQQTNDAIKKTWDGGNWQLELES